MSLRFSNESLPRLLPLWQVVQPDKCTLSLRLRTLGSGAWLHLSWHHTAARISVGAAPQRGDVAEAFSFGEQLAANLRGLVLTGRGTEHL